MTVLVMLALSLFHFLATNSQFLLLKDIAASLLIVILLIAQSILLKFFLSISNSKVAKTSSRVGLWSRIEVLQPLAFFVIFMSVQILTIRLRGFDALVSLVRDPQSFAYYSLALRASDPVTYVREWLAAMQVPLLYWGGHLATHFPGYALLIYSGFHLFGRDPQSVVWLSILLAGSAILPLFYLARLLYGSRAATLACVLYSWTPSTSLNLPYMDLAVGVFVLTALLLFFKSLRTSGGASYSLLGGLILACAMFLTFVSASILVLAAVLTITAKSWWEASLKFFSFLSSAFLPYLILELTLGFPFFEAALWALRTNQWFYQHLHSMMPSVWSIEFSTLFFFLLLGLPVCMVFFLTVFRSFNSSFSQVEGRTFVLGLSATLLLAVVFAKLELARVAAFLTPMLAACVAAEVSKWRPTEFLDANGLLLSYAQCLETYAYVSQTVFLSTVLGYPVV